MSPDDLPKSPEGYVLAGLLVVSFHSLLANCEKSKVRDSCSFVQTASFLQTCFCKSNHSCTNMKCPYPIHMVIKIKNSHPFPYHLPAEK